MAWKVMSKRGAWASPISQLEAYGVIISFLLLIFELAFLPIPSELSSMPDEQQPFHEPFKIFIKLIWPGIPAILAFTAPVARCLISLYHDSPICSKKKMNSRHKTHIYHSMMMIGWICCASVWELSSVLVLRTHRINAEIENALVETAIGMKRGSLCEEGPFYYSRHPINLGLIWTTMTFSVIDASKLTIICSILFCVHLVNKVNRFTTTESYHHYHLHLPC